MLTPGVYIMLENRAPPHCSVEDIVNHYVEKLRDLEGRFSLEPEMKAAIESILYGYINDMYCFTANPKYKDAKPYVNLNLQKDGYHACAGIMCEGLLLELGE